jgi:hypothetical protein
VKDRDAFLQTYRNTCKLHEQIAGQEMLLHEFVTADRAVQRTVFSSGTECVVNFGAEPREVGVGAEVAAFRVGQQAAEDELHLDGPSVRVGPVHAEVEAMLETPERHVVVAVDPLAAGRLLPDELEEQRAFFDSVVASPTPIPVFFLDRPLRDDVWVYANDPRLKRTFMAAWDERAKIPEASPSGRSTVIGWSGHPKTIELMKKSDEEIIREAREDISIMIPGFDGYIEDATVYRHVSGSARYPVGAYRQIVDFKEKAEHLKGISFVGDVFGGAYMEAAMVSAEAAVRRVCRSGDYV